MLPTERSGAAKPGTAPRGARQTPAYESPGACLAPPALPAIATTLDRMALGVAYTFATSPTELAGVGTGWWQAEPFGRWIGADRADLRLHLPIGGDLRIALTGLPYSHAVQLFEVWAGGQKLGADVLSDGSTAEVALKGLEAGGEVDLTLVFLGASSLCPTTLGTAPDARRLLAMIQTLAVRGTPPPPVTPDAATSDAGTPGAAAPPPAGGPCQHPPLRAATLPTQALIAGEPNGVAASPAAFGLGMGPYGPWIGAAEAEIFMILPATPTTSGPVLEISGATFGHPIVYVEVRYQDRLIRSSAFGLDAPLVVPLAGLPRETPVTLRLTFPDTVPTCPAASGTSSDVRELTALIEAVRLQPHVPTAARLPAVAHGGGEVNDTRVTNSLDALDANHDRFHLFEFDLSWAADGELICLHDWDDSFAYRFGTRPDGPQTLAELEALLGDGKSLNCTLATLAAWMRRNPGKRVVTDLKDRNLYGLQMIAARYPDLRAQFVPQATSLTKSTKSKHWALPTSSGQSTVSAVTPTLSRRVA